MTNKLRTTMGGTLLGIALIAIPTCSRRPPTAAETVAGSSLRYLPRVTAGVAVLEASRLEDRAALTRWLGEAMGQATSEPGYASIRAILGADFLQKVDRAAVALIPDATPGPTPRPGWAAVLEGRFDDRMLASIGPEGTLVTLIEVTGGPELSLLALRGKALAFGPRSTLEQIRQVMAHPDTGLGRAALLTTLGKVGSDAHAWGAIDYPPLTELARGAMQGGAPGGAAGALPLLTSRASTLRSVAFEARIAANVGFTLIGVASDGEGAKRLGEAARGLVALARMGAGQGTDRTWFDFLDGLRVSEEKSDVRLTGNLTRPMMDALMARAGQSGIPGMPTGAVPIPGVGASPGSGASDAPADSAPAARP